MKVKWRIGGCGSLAAPIKWAEGTVVGYVSGAARGDVTMMTRAVILCGGVPYSKLITLPIGDLVVTER